MHHACQRFWNCYKTLTFYSLLTGCRFLCACQTKQRFNVQKWREHVMLFTFWLGNVLHATTACAFSTSQLPKALRHWGVLSVLRTTKACTFSTSQLPKVLRQWGFFCVLTSTCASRHNGVQFFISHLPRWLRTRRFSKPTLRPSEATKHVENTCFATFLPFRTPGSSFFWLFLFSDLLPSHFLFSDSSHLYFSICPYCWKFDF